MVKQTIISVKNEYNENPEEALENYYNSKVHPLLNFFNILYNASPTNEKQYLVYQLLGQFLLEKGIDKNIPRNSSIPVLPYNDLIFLCFDVYDDNLIKKIKLIILKKYLACFGKRINDDIICMLFAIFNLGFVVYEDNWYYFRESYHGWKMITDVEILQNINIYLVCDILKASAEQDYDVNDFAMVSEYINRNKISNRAVERLKAILFHAGFKKKLDKKPILRFMDGVYDFELKSLRPGKPSDFCCKGTGYCFQEQNSDDLEHDKEKVLKFLKDIFVEEELIQYVLKILASTLTPGNKLRSLVFFIGNGRNGKTALTNLLKFALGDYTAIPNVSLFLGKSVTSDKANPHMMELNNAHVAICEEPDARSVAITGDAKAITGNVGYIKTRALYKDLEEVYVDLLPIINTNDKLSINNVDLALMDRILVIPFTQRFIPKQMTGPKEENEKYADILWQGDHSKQFAPAFMHLLLEYYQTNYAQLSPPKVVTEATNEFVLRSDHPGRFIKQKLCPTHDDQDILKLEEIYLAYKSWYKNYVNNGTFHYTTEDLRLDFSKYKLYFESQSSTDIYKNSNEDYPRDIDVLRGYKFY